MTVHWVSIRTRWSSGYSSPEYRVSLSPWSDNDIDELCRSINDSNNWSEHYRGVDVISIDCVPPQVLEREINELRRDIAHKTALLNALIG